MTGYDGRGAKFPLTIPRGSDVAFTVTATDDVGAAINLAAATITGNIYNTAGTVAVAMTDSVGGAGSNVITLSLSDTQTTALAATAYRWSLTVTRGTDTRYWLAGAVTMVDASAGRTSNGANATLVVDEDINVAVTVTAASVAAADVSLLDTAGNYTATDVEGALAELPGQYAPRYTVADLYAATIDVGVPITMPHRGAGERIAPENTLEAFRVGAAMGFGIIDGGDLYAPLDSNEDFLICHNSTVDSFTTSTGNVENFDVNGWRNLTVDAGTWFGGGYGDLHPCTFLDVVREFGHKVVLMPEMKSGAGAENDFVALVEKYDLAESIIVQTFSWSQAVTYAAAGLHTMFLYGDVKTPAELIAAGIEWVGISSGEADATFTSFVSAGIKTAVFTIARQYQHDYYVALGCDMVISADPLYSSGQVAKYRSTKSPFASGAWPNGLLAQLATDLTLASRGTMSAGKHTMVTGTPGYLQGYACPVANPSGTYSISVNATFDVLGATDRHFDIIVCCPTDKQFSTNPNDDSYACLLRLDGRMQIYKRASGVTSLISGTTTSTAITVAGTTVPLRVDVTPTTITLTRTDTAATVSVTDSTHRGAYFHMAQDGSAGPLVCSYGGVVVA